MTRPEKKIVVQLADVKNYSDADIKKIHENPQCWDIYWFGIQAMKNTHQYLAYRVHWNPNPPGKRDKRYTIHIGTILADPNYAFTQGDRFYNMIMNGKKDLQKLFKELYAARLIQRI